MTRTIPEESLRLINSVCQSFDCALVDYAVRGNEQRVILDLFIDNRQGVTLDLCSQVNRTLNDESANDKFLSDVYVLEVSSPGVDRPLKFNWQYEKHIGRLLELTLHDGTSVVAHLLSIEGDELQLKPKGKSAKKDRADLRIQLKDCRLIKVVPALR